MDAKPNSFKSREQLKKLHNITQNPAKNIIRKQSELQSHWHLIAFGVIQKENSMINFYFIDLTFG